MNPRSLHRTGQVFLLAAVFLAAGCSRNPEPEAGPAPAAQRAAGRYDLQPPAEAVELADRIELTGTELGTMWTFENPPLEYWRRAYDFQATPQWLEHVRLSSVRYGTYCSASFVSPEGLVMTNHHCARECVEAVSTAETDYVVEGFYAPTRAQEQLCPGLFLDQLVEIEDVTERVRGAAPAGADDEAIAAALEAEQEEIEKECDDARAADFACQVVSLFHGGQYKLYVYRRYQPVKLVFAPELQAGFYGGDPDNFTYPRYALDVSFVRAYGPDGAPARTPHHFEWSPRGAREGDLVFVTGNPGSTTRQVSLAQVLYEREFEHPFIAAVLRAQRDMLRQIAARGPEFERQVRDQLFGVENSLKKYEGEIAGLNDTDLLARKIRWERDFRQRVEASPELRAAYGDVWTRLESIQEQKLAVQPALFLSSPTFFGMGAPQLQVAYQLARIRAQMEMPEAERLPAYRADSLELRRQQLLQPAQLDPATGAAALTRQLAFMRDWLPADDPVIELAVRAGETPEQAAGRLVGETRVGGVEFRQQYLEGTADTADALLRVAARMERRQRELQARMREIQAAETVQQERLAEALFAVYGTDLPPDATFTLRITDGVMKGYPYNGTMAPAKTSIFGLYERAVNFNNAMPFTLPETFAERRADVEMATPYNFVTTNDITGGNSGSPMIDRDARVVGIAFDGNIEQLPNEYVFRDIAGRTVGVHSAGIIEALRSVYQAEALLKELLGTGTRR